MRFYCVRHHCFILKYSVSVHVLYTSDYIIFNLYNLSNAFLSKSASKENRGNTTSSMGQRAGSKVGAVLDT
ncbi:hypothetical protein GPK80_14045, partial [Coprococcus comes]|nr:hypothetical protein [Coprococcus comes]